MTYNIDLNLLYKLYVVEKKPPPEVADTLGVGRTVICDRLRENGWYRSFSEAQKIRFERRQNEVDKDLLYCLYVIEKKILRQVANIIGCGMGFLYARFEDFGISMRSRSEAWKLRDQHVGPIKSPNGKELLLYDIVEMMFPGEFGLNVNGEIQRKLGLDFSRKEPDILSLNGQKLIILHNGCYYHACEQCGYGDVVVRGVSADEIHRKDFDTVMLYFYLGYAVLIIWEHEWDSIEEVMIRIRDFVENPEYFAQSFLGGEYERG